MKNEKPRKRLDNYTRMTVELPEHPEIARIIRPDRERIYINASARPDAKVDYLMAHGMVFRVLDTDKEG